MHPYLEVLNKYFEENPLHGCCGMPVGLLDMLFCCYRQHHNADTDRVKEYCRQMDALLGRLSLAENDEIFGLVFAISDEYRSEAFRDGVAAGMRLYRELLQR